MIFFRLFIRAVARLTIASACYVCGFLSHFVHAEDSPTATESPELYSPADGQRTTAPLTVSYFLPEAAAPSTLKLILSGETMVELTIDATGETAGAHSFSFDPGDPESGPFVGNRPSIPDGIYSIFVSYQDAALNPVAISVAHTVFALDTTGPMILVRYPFSEFLAIQEGAGLSDYTSRVVGIDEGPGLPSMIMQSPEPGTVLSVGVHEVVLRTSDDLGNETASVFKVKVAPSNPVLTVMFSTDALVPSAGEADSGIPQGAVWESFGNPAVNDDGDVAMIATYRVGSTKYKNIALKRGTAANVKMVAQVDGPVPGAGTDWDLPADATFSTIGDPLLAADASVLFVGTIKGSRVNRANHKVVVHYSGGVGRVVARTGTAIPSADGAILKSIGAIALESGDAAVLRGTLSGGSGSPKVGANNDMVALQLNITSGEPIVLLREGYSPGGSAPVIKSFLTLVAGDGAVSQSRGWLARTRSSFFENPNPGPAVFSAFATAMNGHRFLVEISLEPGATPVVRWLTGPDGFGAGHTFAGDVGLPSRSASGSCVSDMGKRPLNHSSKV